jgi:hypothetical protein
MNHVSLLIFMSTSQHGFKFQLMKYFNIFAQKNTWTSFPVLVYSVGKQDKQAFFHDTIEIC